MGLVQAVTVQARSDASARNPGRRRRRARSSRAGLEADQLIRQLVVDVRAVFLNKGDSRPAVKSTRGKTWARRITKSRTAAVEIAGGRCKAGESRGVVQ